MRIGLNTERLLFLSDSKDTSVFLRFSPNLQIRNFMKIRPVKAELFLADGRTDRRADMTKLTVAFRNFATAPRRAHRLFHNLCRRYNNQLVCHRSDVSVAPW